MSLCPMCKVDSEIIGEMDLVVEAAEVLIDAAAEDDKAAVVEHAAGLRFAVLAYRAKKHTIKEEGENAVQ